MDLVVGSNEDRIKSSIEERVVCYVANSLNTILLTVIVLVEYNIWYIECMEQ